jgi:hypothetical protein
MAGLFLAVALAYTMMQGSSLGTIFNLFSCGVAIVVGVGVNEPGYIGVTRAARWRDVEPWASPFVDVALVVMLVLLALPLLLPASAT